ncbi:MAG: copper chaperone PCu(A)C [Gammaproteobacteria bacterium]|nr:copper chaperone PCu(A)C [Gammaproteobacteria bacterium]
MSAHDFLLPRLRYHLVLNARRLVIACCGLLICSRPGIAHEYYAKQFVLIHPWTEPTEPGQTDARVHFRLESITGPDRLLGASFPFRAREVELRAGPDDAVPALTAIDISPGERFEFVPSGVHLLIKGLTEPLSADRSYPLVLRFESSGTLVVMMSMSGVD